MFFDQFVHSGVTGNRQTAAVVLYVYSIYSPTADRWVVLHSDMCIWAFVSAAGLKSHILMYGFCICRDPSRSAVHLGRATYIIL